VVDGWIADGHAPPRLSYTALHALATRVSNALRTPPALRHRIELPLLGRGAVSVWVQETAPDKAMVYVSRQHSVEV
jgi:hypothetical protein